MRPLIGITGRKDASARLLVTPMHAVGETYVRAIARVGGTPVIVPPVMNEEDWRALADRLDGLLLTGGEDIDPACYGQEHEPWLGRVDGERDASELGLIHTWLELGKPLLAICRGHQVLNVALGGTLYQDIAAHIPNALDHAYTPARPMERPAHLVQIETSSQLAKILGGTEFEVNSAHHQSNHKAGNGLIYTASAPDGVIEATELTGHPFCLSVQWHPEAMVKTSDSMWPLFRALIEAVKA